MLPIRIWLCLLIFTAPYVQAGPVAPWPGQNGPNGAAPVPAPPVAPATGTVIAVPVQSAPPQKQNNAAQVLNALLSAIGGQGGNPRKDFGDTVPPGTDFSRWEYPDNFRYHYGGKGAGNIGSGLCTSENEKRTQVQKGYCKMLTDLLNQEGSCANREMNQIIQKAGADGSGIRDLPGFCPQFGQFQNGAQKSMIFTQILAALIVQESGWNATAQEQPWTKNGHQMGGKGLFQIGADDRSKDSDCHEINSSSILDAKTNIKCGACIALKYLNLDRAMGNGVGDDPRTGAKGMGRYFGPYRDGQAGKREAMRGAVHSYCDSRSNGGGAKDMTINGLGAPQPNSTGSEK